MKKAFLAIAALFITLASFAKTNPADDPKYGRGAVPVDDNGMVSFTYTADIPQDMTEENCYQLLLSWAKGRFSAPQANAGRFLNEDTANRHYIINVDQMITFKRNDFVIDESRITYNFSVVVNDGKFTVTMTDIKYRYEENRDGGQSFTAEEWITDDEAYNKKGNKFLKNTGKFRIKTIDLKDNLFKNLSEVIKN